MTFYKNDPNNKVTYTSEKHTFLTIGNVKIKKDKKQKIIFFRISYKSGSNSNVTSCDKSVTFFIFSMHRVMHRKSDILSVYLGLNVCFYTLFFVCILGLL